MLFVLVGWVLFRAANFSTAGSILLSLIGAGGINGALQKIPLLIGAAFACALIPSSLCRSVRPPARSMAHQVEILEWLRCPT